MLKIHDSKQAKNVTPPCEERNEATQPLSDEQYDALERMGPPRRGKVIWSLIDEE